MLISVYNQLFSCRPLSEPLIHDTQQDPENKDNSYCGHLCIGPERYPMK
jgi:hypothetical protein